MSFFFLSLFVYLSSFCEACWLLSVLFGIDGKEKKITSIRNCRSEIHTFLFLVYSCLFVFVDFNATNRFVTLLIWWLNHW